MGASKLNIAILTSSRADYGIYLPLLKALKKDATIHVEIIAFGSHCNEKFGFTVKEIEKDGFVVKHKINNLIDGDSPTDIALSYANTVKLFSTFWKNNTYNWVLCLGDRFEMAAAVNAGIPFGVNFAHFYAGDTTLGAIDNIYRDQISLASKLFFVSLPNHVKQITQLTNSKTNPVYVIGAISLENLKDIKLLTLTAFKQKWDIDLTVPTILTTIHPETIDFESNKSFAKESIEALQTLLKKYQIVITMPNADTSGTIFREAFIQLAKENTKSVKLIENFGTQSYFTCMKYATLLLGNTSSGIIEAATFNKFVINLGNRQKGRIAGNNVFHIPFNAKKIIETVQHINNKTYLDKNVYYYDNAITSIVEALKKHYK